MDDLAIQIVNFNTKKYLQGCLELVLADLRGSPIHYTVNVLDNASSDDLSDLEARYHPEKVSFFKNNKNVGFGAGHNVLSEKSTAEYLLLLNPDIKFLEPNTIKRLLQQMKAVRAAAIGPRLVLENGKVQPWDHGELHGFRARVALGSGTQFWRDRKDLTEVAWVSGACFLVKQDAFRAAGKFDEHYFLYSEEVDLCLEMRALGGKIIYDPGVTVLHYGSVVAKKSDHMRASNDYYLEKHFKNKRGYRLYRLINHWMN